jgi:hypothetical protein
MTKNLKKEKRLVVAVSFLKKAMGGPWKVFSLTESGFCPFIISKHGKYDGQKIYRSFEGARRVCNERNEIWNEGFKEGSK